LKGGNLQFSPPDAGFDGERRSMGGASMRRIALLALLLMLGQGAISAASAAPATAKGTAALALAAVVAEYSPWMSARDRTALARLFDGHSDFAAPTNQKISVTADAVVCRTSNVDITARSCKLTLGTHTRALKGRRANELNATATEAGAPSEGAAGSIITSLSHLVCTIDLNEVKQKAGGGADCTFDTGQ
jgi:hypothetical protein